MPDQERLKDRLKNKFKHFLHSVVPARSRSSSPNRPITPTLDHPIGTDPTSIHGIPDTQPLDSPSLSNIYPSIVINPGEDETPGRMADLFSTGFEGVKTTLRLVEKVASGFPPLKMAVSGLLGVIDIVEASDFRISAVIGWC